MPTGRPVFHEKIGLEFAKLREARGWSAQQAVNAARGKKHKALTAQSLRYLEEGRTKHPDAGTLRAVADAYGLDYRSLAIRFVEQNYGSDLLRHGPDQASTAELGGPSVDAAATRLLTERDHRIHALETQLDRLQGIADELLDILSAARSEGAAVAGRRPKRGSRDRAPHR